MKLQYIRPFVVLLAGLITLIINMRIGRDVTKSLLIELIVLIIFYIISSLCVEILQKGLPLAARKDEQSYSDVDEEIDENEISDENEDNDLSQNDNVEDEDF